VIEVPSPAKVTGNFVSPDIQIPQSVDVIDRVVPLNDDIELIAAQT
jgi:hypothetical protein